MFVAISFLYSLLSAGFTFLVNVLSYPCLPHRLVHIGLCMFFHFCISVADCLSTTLSPTIFVFMSTMPMASHVVLMITIAHLYHIVVFFHALFPIFLLFQSIVLWLSDLHLECSLWPHFCFCLGLTSSSLAAIEILPQNQHPSPPHPTSIALCLHMTITTWFLHAYLQDPLCLPLRDPQTAITIHIISFAM